MRFRSVNLEHVLRRGAQRWIDVTSTACAALVVNQVAPSKNPAILVGDDLIGASAMAQFKLVFLSCKGPTACASARGGDLNSRFFQCCAIYACDHVVLGKDMPEENIPNGERQHVLLMHSVFGTHAHDFDAVDSFGAAS